MLVGDIDKRIRKSVHDPKLRQLWVEKGKTTEESDLAIDWEAIGLAAKGARKRQTTTITKLLSDNAPTNDNMVLWGYRTCQKCPRCGIKVETSDHVIRCNNPQGINVFEASLTKLNDWLIKQQTEPNLRQGIIVTLRNWKRGTPERIRTTRSVSYTHLTLPTILLV